MPLGTVNLPPGVVRNGTRYQVKGRWWDANLVRWFDGQARPIGGWLKLNTTPLTGRGRRLLTWSDNSNDRWVAVGTSSKLYVSQGAATVHDITPAGLVTGGDDATQQFGYGGGLYGAGTYGTPRDGAAYTEPTIWFLDNWGQNLVGMATSDGRLFEWGLNTGTPAAVIANAPINNAGMLVTEERHLVALGAGGNVRRVEWSGKEDNTLWTPAETNEAGGFELQTESPIVAGVRIRGKLVILTKADAHTMTYIGQPFIFNRECVGNGCGLSAPGALISAGSQAFWMSDSSFWIYDGTTARPLACDVSEYVFGNMSETNAYKTTSGINPQYGEVWWFYCSAGADEPDRYVVYSYREGHWTIGELARTAWHSGEVFGSPYAVGPDGYIYIHEQGHLADGASMYASQRLVSGVLELDDGERIMHVNQVIPDEDTKGEVKIEFETRFTPNGDTFSFGPYLVRGDGYTDTRLSGRQVTMTVKPTVDDDWRIGKFRMDLRTGGMR